MVSKVNACSSLMFIMSVVLKLRFKKKNGKVFFFFFPVQKISVFCCHSLLRTQKNLNKIRLLLVIRHLHNSSDSQPLLCLSHYFLPASNNFIWLDNQYKAHLSEEYVSLCIAKGVQRNSFLNNEIC